jgi:hypothetical protein
MKKNEYTPNEFFKRLLIIRLLNFILKDRKRIILTFLILILIGILKLDFLIMILTIEVLIEICIYSIIDLIKLF